MDQPTVLKRLHLVVVLYKSAEALPAFLRCLQAQTLTHWRLVAVDNASADGSAELIADLGDDRTVLLRNDRNLGFAAAANQGLREAAAEGATDFVLINPDTMFEPDFLQSMQDRQRATNAAVLAPRIMRADKPHEAWYAGGHFTRDWVFWNAHEPYDAAVDAGVRPVEFASGCCLLLCRDVLERVGLLDERFFVYWEDTDFCLRLAQQGIAITYVADLVMLHEGGASTGGEFSTGYSALYYRSYTQLLRKHFGMRAALATIMRLMKAAMLQRPTPWRTMVREAGAMLSGIVACTPATKGLDAAASKISETRPG
jgi:GT2 family glycosyltransferase